MTWTIHTPALILVVDDDPLFRSFVARNVGGPYRVLTAADGHEAYGIAVATRPVAIIIDTRMPGWDGLHTLRALRGHATLEKTPVLLLAADEDEAEQLTRAALSRVQVLNKARFRADDLQAAIREMCREMDAPHPPRPVNSVPAPHASWRARAAVVDHAAARIR